MRVSWTWRVVAAGLLLAVIAPIGAWAGAPTDQVQRGVDQVIRLLEDPALKQNGRLPERRVAMRRVANEIFDFPEMSKRSLGRHWQARTPAEREEFTAAFTDLLEYTYVTKIESYSGEKVQYVSEQLDGSDYAVVRTRLVTSQGVEIPIDYRMSRRAGQWRAYDVAIEGVSLVANYRTQFNAILQRSTYSKLITALKEKAARADGAAPRGGSPKDKGSAPGGARPGPQNP